MPQATRAKRSAQAMPAGKVKSQQKTVRATSSRPLTPKSRPEGHLARTGFAATGNTAEVRLTATDYLDFAPSDPSAASVLVYSFSDHQPSLGGDAATALSVPKSVKVWSLPTSQPGTNESATYVAAFGVCGAQNGAGDPTGHRLLAQRTTVVKPDFQVEWQLIGEASYDKVFKDGIVQMSHDNGAYGLFELTLVDPDGGSAYTSPVQLAVSVTYTQTLPISTLARSGQTYNTAFLEPGRGTINASVAQVELKGLTHSR